MIVIPFRSMAVGIVGYGVGVCVGDGFVYGPVAEQINFPVIHINEEKDAALLAEEAVVIAGGKLGGGGAVRG